MRLHILWALLFIVILAGIGGGYYLYQKDTKALEDLVSKQSEELSNLQERYLEELQIVNRTLIEYQKGAEVENQELEQLLARQENQFQNRLQDIERKKEISEQLLTTTNQDLAQNIDSLTDKLFELESNSKSSIIQKWDAVTVRMSCIYETEERSYGSGLYLGIDSAVNLGAGNEHVILTNSHVLEEGNEVPTSCEFVWNTRETTTLVFDPSERISRFSFFEGFDAAFVTLDAQNIPESVISNTAEYPICSVSPQIGEEVLILGYPKIGSTDSITGTEGIISGYDGNFFITSAKISKGNSGGAAISVQDNCYFGIPTLVKADEVESLGRILDITNIFK